MTEKYHYTLSGLQNIWILNGFKKIKTSSGVAYSIIDSEGLDKAIANRLITHKPRLSGGEFRFIRKQLGLSQKGLAEIMGVQPLQVNRWETKSLTKMADYFLRALYVETLKGNKKASDVINSLNNRDQQDFEEMQFKMKSKDWAVA